MQEGVPTRDRYGAAQALQQLPVPGVPPCKRQVSELALMLQRVVTGHSLSSVQVSGGSVLTHMPSSHTPGLERQHVTDPSGFPHVDRAAQRLMLVFAVLSRHPAWRSA